MREPRARPDARIDVQARRFIGTAELAGRLGYGELTQRTIVDRLRGLHRHMGLPLPRNQRFVGGAPARGAAAIWWGSLWDRGEMLVWLDHGATPPAARTAADAPPATDPALRERQREAAARLCGAARNTAKAASA